MKEGPDIRGSVMLKKRTRNRLARRFLVVGFCMAGLKARTRLQRPCARRTGRQHPAKHLNRLPHLLHRAERDAAVRLLVRREVAADANLLRGARIAEPARRTLQIDEDAIGMRVGGLVAETAERLER